jgi:hypothetical protein
MFSNSNSLVSSLCFSFFLVTSLAWGQDRLKVTLDFQPDSTVTVTAIYTMEERTDDSVYVILNPGFQPLQIKAEGLVRNQMAPRPGRPFPFWLLTFDPASPVKNVPVTFNYSIDLKQMNHINSGWIELNVDKLWFPNFHDLDNEFSWDVTINNLYTGYSLVSYEIKNDNITPVIRMNPKGTIRITNDEPCPEIFIMAGANMQLWESPNRDQKTRLFVSGNESDSTLLSIANRADEIINFFNDTFKANPIDDYLLVLRNTPPGEINFLQSRGNILLGNSFASSYASLSHEVSHYWWSKADFINEPWMNESFANYSMLLLLESYDKEQFEKQLNRIKEGGVKGGSLRNTTTFDPNGMATYYFKGCQLLWELDSEIGRDAFIQLLVERIKQDANSTDEFLQLIKVSNGAEVQSSFASKLD